MALAPIPWQCRTGTRYGSDNQPQENQTSSRTKYWLQKGQQRCNGVAGGLSERLWVWR